MELTNPAVTDGVNLFVNIVVISVAFIVALSMIDAKKVNDKEKSLTKQLQIIIHDPFCEC